MAEKERFRTECMAEKERFRTECMTEKVTKLSFKFCECMAEKEDSELVTKLYVWQKKKDSELNEKERFKTECMAEKERFRTGDKTEF